MIRFHKFAFWSKKIRSCAPGFKVFQELFVYSSRSNPSILKNDRAVIPQFMVTLSIQMSAASLLSKLLK